MNILIITNLSNNRSSGIANIVPLNIQSLSKKCNLSWYNLNKNYNSNFKNKNYYFSEGKEFKKIISESTIDLVVFHGIFFLRYFFIGKVLKNKKIPYIIVPHGSLTFQALKKKRIKKWISFKIMFDTFIKNALSIQYLTPGERDLSLKKNLTQSIIIPNGININRKTEKIKVKTANTLKGIFIGRKDIKGKGLDIFLEACRISKDELKKNNVSIDIYGPEENNSNTFLENMISKKKIKDLVRIKGAVFGEEKKEIIRNSQFFILTSLSEGHPVSILEALALGKPCLVTKETNVAKEIEEYNSGWVAKKTEPLEISLELKKIISDRENLDSFSKNAILMSKDYLWENITKNTLDKYKKLIR